MKERRERDGGRENRRPRRIGWSQRNSSDWWIQAIPHRVLFFSIHFRRRCPFLLLLSIIVCLFVCPYVMYVCGMWDVGVWVSIYYIVCIVTSQKNKLMERAPTEIHAFISTLWMNDVCVWCILYCVCDMCVGARRCVMCMCGRYICVFYMV